MSAICDATRKLTVPPENLRDTDKLQVRLSKNADHFLIDLFAESVYTAASGETLINRNHPSYGAKEWLQRFPESKRIESPRYLISMVPATDISAAVIDSWPAERKILESDASQVLQYLRQQSGVTLLAARNTAQYKASGALPKFPLAVHPEHPLSNYQKVAAVNATLCDGYAFLMEQGTGKTPTQIATICNQSLRHKRDTGNMALHLIVVPPAVLLNWAEEIRTFATVKTKITTLRGDKIKSLGLYIEAITNDDNYTQSVVLCSYDALEPRLPFLCRTNWQSISADESQNFKDPGSKRWKCLVQLRDRAEKRMILTGTPIGNEIGDLWTQLEFLGEGYSGFSSHSAFRQFYGVFDNYGGNGDGFGKLVGLQNLPFIHERLARRSFSITLREALPQLPDKLYSVQAVEMSAKQAAIYREVATKLLAEIEDDLEKSTNKQLTVTNALTKMLRLAQITSGFVVYDEVWNEDRTELLKPREVDRIDPNPKLEALVEFLKRQLENPNSKSIVWACWDQDIKSITARLRMEGIGCTQYYGKINKAEKDAAVFTYNNDPNCRILIGNSASGGTGLNLWGYNPKADPVADTNTDHIHYYSQGWSSIYRRQSEARAHRRKTRCNVNIIDWCVPGTIDEEIRHRVLQKTENALKAGDVREILRNVLNAM